MEAADDSQATQQATQNALDPRRLGKQNSGFSDEDISDIICLLYPNTEGASREVERLAQSPEYSHHTTGRYTADAIDSDLSREDDVREFGRTRGIGDHAIVLRLSTALKDPSKGFTVGRNRTRCDICFAYDPGKRLSNIHFRIYVNHDGIVLLQDESTNGTVVDHNLLRKKKNERKNESGKGHMRTLQSGSTIQIIMHATACDLSFLVRIPRRERDHEDAYLRKLVPYLQRMHGDDDPNKTICPGPSGHVNLFPARRGLPTERLDTTQAVSVQRIPREWHGGDKYARVGVIGKGAFATVHKVTSKYDGSPYAAKELDKRKFMKNGVLDQKVENEMKIMQKVQHPNIVQYIEHFDWDAHQFIIIMEYVPGGDLGKFISENGGIAEPHVKIISSQLIDALGYLHENRITHRDVKPDNILIQSTNPLVVKLTDFGLSKMIDTEQTFLKTFCGTLLYCAPEVYNEYSSYDDTGRRTQRKNHKPIDRERYDHAIDIWSLGGVLFYTLTGSPPFPVKNGITYTELLDHIIKTPLDTAPLTRAGVSRNGINFLLRMIHVRPETRATISELQAHSWLMPSTDSSDQLSDVELEFNASQLSLDDRHQDEYNDLGASSLDEPEPDFSIDDESEKENYTFGEPEPEPQQNRLFGEVSALGSSGAIGEDRLNLRSRASSSCETEILEQEIMDSFEESDNFSTPRQKAPVRRSNLSASPTPSDDNSRSAVLGIGSQSLGGASSIFGNLNMQSVANGNRTASSSRIADMTSSKRKPAFDTSDEYESALSNLKPSIKRLKSQCDTDIPSHDEDEDILFACLPPMVKNETGRQIDYPLPKTTFWDSSDKNTWHLHYPEMTHLQYNLFEKAAVKRGEEFGPGKSPLWNLAMKYFPPTQRHRNGSRQLEMRPVGLELDTRTTRESSDWDMPPTASPPGIGEDLESLPDTLPPENTFPPTLSVVQPSKTVVGMFYSAQGSLVAGISIPLKDPVLSWGRDRSNTVLYQPALESKVPKNAFRVVLWTESSSSSGEFRPWEPTRSAASRTIRASPGPDSYAFYISTKATNGIRVNNNPLPPHDPKDSTAPSKYWMKLHHGDTVVFWGTDDVDRQAKLTFECFWGGSSVPRPADEPPTCVPESIARKLDRLWPKSLTTLHHDRIKAEAQTDQEARMRQMAREQERSRVFEERRAEAVRAITLRSASRTSLASAPPISRPVPQFRQTSPLA